MCVCVWQNSPNDLQMLSDAPAHHIFVLLGPVDGKMTGLPNVLCVIQVRGVCVCVCVCVCACRSVCVGVWLAGLVDECVCK